MIECDAPVRLQEIPAPDADFDSLVSVVNAAYEHEQVVTRQIDALASLALDRRDFNTFNMLQWFIAEQCEELVLFRGIVDYMALAGFTGGPGDAAGQPRPVPGHEGAGRRLSRGGRGAGSDTPVSVTSATPVSVT